MVKGKQAVNLSLRAKIKDGNTISIEITDLNNQDCYHCVWQFRTNKAPVVIRKDEHSELKSTGKEV